MLKKAVRLNHALFTTCYKQGRKTHGDYTTVVHCPSEEFKVAVVVGKKVAKKAVDRNSIKRRVYEIVRSFKTNQKGIFIFIIKPKITSLSKKQFQTVVTQEVGRFIN